MAERKYDLALVNTLTDKKVRLHPWYKERLQTKHIKSLKPADTSKCLMGKDWLFLKDGLDDFRDGLPPPVQGDVFIKGSKGPGPNVKHSSENAKVVKQPAVRNRFSKHQICYSRLTPLQQQRRDHIDEIEYGLTQHPLALYPHLEESVNPELFEDIVDILDPEMNLDSEVGSLEDYDDEEEETQKSDDEEDKSPEADLDKAPETDENVVRNPYRWLPRKEEKEKKDKKKSTDRGGQGSPSRGEHIQKVTKEFCDWVASLGGEENNIEESTITSLFASGYETKPALSVPIHVVELTNVPQDLRSTAPGAQTQQTNKNIPPPEIKKENWSYTGKYEPSWVKFKYGSWYLDPKTWKMRNFTDPLMDPKEIKDKEMSEAKKRSKELNQEISISHGAKAFTEFMNRRDDRKPEFLVEVEDIQQKAAEEEARKLEAELAAKNKTFLYRKKADAVEAT
ncbi:protein FAM47E-like [Pecten maximus]|uniref:protein FAM47E-like n=1 Tax=Pecten maximus TaxID=6579 RepID=UPI001458D4E8|nr:protein FAM47E-like [Pecten maximus]